MAQRGAVAPPGVEKARLGMEQSPIHEPAPRLRPILQQAVAVGIEQQHRHLPGQLRQRAGGDAADAGNRLAGTAFDADRDPPTVVAVHDRHHPEGRYGALNQLPRLAGAERAAPAQKVQCLQQTGLAGGVGADQQVQAGRARQADPPQIAEPGDVEGSDPHPRLSASGPDRRSPTTHH